MVRGLVVALSIITGVGLPALAAPTADASVSTGVNVRVLALPMGGSQNTELASVSCVSTNFCIAVGTYRTQAASKNLGKEHSVIMRFNGRKWTVVDAPTMADSELNGIDCLSRSSCVAVGEQISNEGSSAPIVEELNGTSWSLTPLANPSIYPIDATQLHAVSCVSAGNCTAVGWDSGLGYVRGVMPTTGIIAHESPAGWAIQTLAPLVPTRVNSPLGYVVVPSNAFDPSYLMSVSCTPARCLAVGQGESFVEAGGNWSELTTFPLVLNGLTCTAEQACLGVGHAGQGLGGSVVVSTSTAVAQLSGSHWHRVPSPNRTAPSNVLSAVACRAGQSCVAVGSVSGAPVLSPHVNAQGGLLVETERGERWVLAKPLRTSKSIDDTLASVSCPSLHTCIAVGNSASDSLRIPSGPIRALATLISH